MRLSTKGRYGVRLMMELAMHYGKKAVALKDISDKQGISKKYLWQLIAPLKAAGFITSDRGSHGGYHLVRPPSEINLKEIVGALEGSLYPSACVEDTSVCARCNICATRDVWKKVGEKINEVLESVTLEKIIETQKNNMENNRTAMYNI